MVGCQFIFRAAAATFLFAEEKQTRETWEFAKHRIQRLRLLCFSLALLPLQDEIGCNSFKAAATCAAFLSN